MIGFLYFLVKYNIWMSSINWSYFVSDQILLPTDRISKKYPARTASLGQAHVGEATQGF